MLAAAFKRGGGAFATAAKCIRHASALQSFFRGGHSLRDDVSRASGLVARQCMHVARPDEIRPKE
jgi:hypothetical protein